MSATIDLGVDLNSDMGEMAESLANGVERELMRWITSANVACGGHAGDERMMRETVELAREAGVAVGAHPGYPDRANFGRVEMNLSAAEVQDFVREQILALARVAGGLGVGLRHVKPHGALYHAANRERAVAEAIGRAVRAVDSRLAMVGQAGADCLEVWRGMGLRAVGEAFADRAYEKDGALRSRKLAGALIEAPERAAAQAVGIAARREVDEAGGSKLAVDAETICIHSDTPSAAAIARAVRQGLEAAGVRVRAIGGS
jgi:5-oxoprolinase (ATP-hydrolysing) subunit A